MGQSAHHRTVGRYVCAYHQTLFPSECALPTVRGFATKPDCNQAGGGCWDGLDKPFLHGGRRRCARLPLHLHTALSSGSGGRAGGRAGGDAHATASTTLGNCICSTLLAAANQAGCRPSPRRAASRTRSLTTSTARGRPPLPSRCPEVTWGAIRRGRSLEALAAHSRRFGW